MTVLTIPTGIHPQLATSPAHPLGDLELIRKKWKVVTAKKAKVPETEAAKLLRFIIDLHAALERHDRPDDYDARPGKFLMDSILSSVGVEGQPNPQLPLSWLDALQPVWKSWLKADTVNKRRREATGWLRHRDEASGEFSVMPKREDSTNDGEFRPGNRHRFSKKAGS